MNCPSCGAPLRLANGNASLRCDYCKSTVIAVADDSGTVFLDEAKDLPCPACANSLWSAVLARVSLHSCKHCHGLLVPMGAFEALVDQMRADRAEITIPAPSDEADLDRKVKCPKCGQRMDTHFYYGGGHAVMSTCERCELDWLEGGVMMRIVHAPHPGDPKPR